MQKKLLSILLAVSLMVQMSPVMAMAEETSAIFAGGISVDEPGKGDGTTETTPGGDTITAGVGASGLLLADKNKPTQDVEGTYQIGTAAELAWFRDYVNGAKSDESDARYASNAVLTADIVLTDTNWTPISNRSYVSEQYSGTFNGESNGVRRTISGLKVSSTSANVGLFGAVNGATIKNLIVVGDVKSSNNYVGGIVGKISLATIENCSFDGTVISTKADAYVGGIVGGDQNGPSTISGCVNMADVTGDVVGGIAGYTKGSKNAIKNCYNTGTITGTLSAGGITGKTTSGSVENCYNIGEIASTSGFLGGIAGEYNSAMTMANGYHLYPEIENPSGNHTATQISTKIAGPNNLSANALNSDAFVDGKDGVNGGYPMLLWQSPPDLSPSISFNGNATIYVENGKPNETPLLVALNNIDESSATIVWEVATANGNADYKDIVEVIRSETDNKTLIIKAVGGGTVTVSVTVTAEVEGEAFADTKECTVSVIPQITTGKIENVIQPGAVAMGQTVGIKVNVLGGGEYDHANLPPLTYQWTYRARGAEASADIVGATEKTFTIPTDAGYKEWDYLSVEIKSGGAVVKSAKDGQADLRSQDYGILYPVAYDPNFNIPKKIKDDKPLVLPTTHTVNGVTAAISWTSANNSVINPTTGVVTRPATGTTEVTLTARFEYGTAFANQLPTITVYSKQAAEAEDNKSYLQQAVDSLDNWYGPMEPVYGTDANITAMLKADLAAKGYGDLSVGVKSITERYDGASLAPNGDITSYFYADPNGERGLWLGQYGVTFTLSKDADTLDTAVIPVNIHWDRDRVNDVLRSEILPGVTEEIVLGENIDKDNVISSLVLPRVVDGKRWALIEWSSSDPATVFISNENQGTADTLFDPYLGKIIRGEDEKEVTLTAKFNFQRTANGQPEIALYKTFTFTVPPLTSAEADAIRTELLGKLNTGFDTVGLRDYVTGERLTEKDGIYTAANDIQLPTTRDFGVDGKYFPINITASDSITLVTPDVANAARVTVYRPAVGASAKTAVLTVSITDLARGVSASKSFTVEVLPLVQAELDNALALMDRAKTAYFEGLNDGKYADDFSLTGGLHPFQEAVWDAPANRNSRSANANETTGELRWIYDSKEVTKSGIVADELNNWAEQEAWRAFRSSDMTILDSETLNHVKQPTEDTFVRINSTLTHAVYGKYAGMEGYEGLEQLSNQDVAVYVMVAGKHHPERTQAELLKMREEAIARIDTPISAGFTLLGKKPQAQTYSASMAPRPSDVLIDSTVGNLEAGTTVFGLFRKALAEQGYTYKSVGSYIKSVTDANGNTLAEGDAGGNSGWIYTVNGKMPSIYMNGYSLKEGDEVVVRFTEDYTKEDSFDDGDDDKDGNDSIGGNGEKPGVNETPATGTSPVTTPVAVGDAQTATAPVTTDSVAPGDSAPTPAAPQAPVAETPAFKGGTGEVNGDLSGEPVAATAASPSPIALVAIVLVLGAAIAGGLFWKKKRNSGENN